MQKTSLQAYKELEATGSLSKRRLQICKTLAAARKALTASEICVEMWKAVGQSVPRDSVSPRLAELRRMGLVREAGTKKCSVTGKTTLTWQFTAEKPKKLEMLKKPRQWWLVERPNAIDPVVFTQAAHAHDYAKRNRANVIEVVERNP